MSTVARRRLIRDFKTLQSDAPLGISGAPREDNLLFWDVALFGPERTVWEGGVFHLTMEFTEEYPTTAPKVKFVSPMWHPNVYSDGSICLDILDKQWSSLYDISAILQSLQLLLCDPNPASPANTEAAKLFASDPTEYHRRIKEVLERSWEYAAVRR